MTEDVSQNSGAEITVDPCRNCGAPVGSRYCPQCGQSVERSVRPFGVFLRDTLNEIIALDGTLGRTFSTLLRAPGQLTVDYLAGRRAGFLTPMRTFIDAGVLASLVTWLIPETWPLFGVGPILFGEDTSLVELFGAAAVVPFAMLAHWLALRRTRPMIMEHGVFVLHTAAFSFLLAPLEGLLYWLAPQAPFIQTSVALFAPIVCGLYWWAALARFTGKPMRSALVDAFRVYGATLILLIPVLLFMLVLG